MKHAIAALFLGLLMLLSPALPARASAAGSWYIYPQFAMPPQKVIDTDKVVYFASGGRLFSYDKKNDENYSYTIQNKLTDSDITGIFYNYDRHYLVICYSTGNIDLLYDDGTVRNLSDIKDSSIPAPLTINNVVFDGDDIYCATSFGLVRFNEPCGEVVTSGNYGTPVNALCVMGDYLIIQTNDNLYRGPKSAMLSSFDIFSKMYGCEPPAEMWADSDDSYIILFRKGEGMLSRYEITEPTATVVNRTILTDNHSRPAPYVTRTADGDVYYMADGNLYRLSVENGRPETTKEQLLTRLPDEFADGIVGTSKGIDEVWSLTRDGLGQYAFDGEGGTTMLMDRYRPDGLTISKARYFFPSSDGKRLYVQNSGVFTYLFGRPDRGLGNIQAAACLDLVSGKYTDATAYPVEAVIEQNKNLQRSLGLYAIAPIGIVEDPNDPEIRYLATSDDGIFKLRGSTVIGRFGHENSPITYIDNRDVVYGIGFDNFGNLWVMDYADSNDYRPLSILPADKVRKPTEEITVSDWISPDFSEIGYSGGQDVRMLFCKKSNLVVIASTGSHLFVYDHKGTGSDFSDDRWVHIGQSFRDQDGRDFSSIYKACLSEDNNGKIWVGTESGIMELNPSKIFESPASCTRIKVPRNDGTNLADYLLSTDLSVSITVDNANRKWIATTTSGIYCVSPSGNEIIYNFTAENSPLPTNYINALYFDKAAGTLYIGTDDCVLSFSGSSTASRDSYDNMLIYPNPVRPEYLGGVTIAGLMDNSLVKIADAAGHVICQGRSEGGEFKWNVCNSSGHRVASGVYYVFVSQNSSGSSAAVGKIMVIN